MGGGSRRSPLPLLGTSNNNFYLGGPFHPLMGGLFTLLWGPFSPYEGPHFSFWVALFLPLHCFGGYFLRVRDYFSPYVECFSGMPSLTKIDASAHAFAARVVASAAHSGNLREIVRLNLLIHFIAHFHVMLGKPMK